MYVCIKTYTVNEYQRILFLNVLHCVNLDCHLNKAVEMIHINIIYCVDRRRRYHRAGIQRRKQQ